MTDAKVLDALVNYLNWIAQGKNAIPEAGAPGLRRVARLMSSISHKVKAQTRHGATLRRHALETRRLYRRKRA